MVKRNGVMDSLTSRFTQEWGNRTIQTCDDIEKLRAFTQELWVSNKMLKDMVGMMILQGIPKQPLTPDA